MNYNEGSTPKAEKESLEMVREKVLTHLETKYGKEFQCLAYESASAMRNHYTFVVTEEGNTDASEEFEAFYYPEEQNPYRDSYCGLSLRTLVAEEALKSATPKEDFKAFVQFRKSSFSDTLKPGASLEEAVKAEGELRSVIYVFGVQNLDMESVSDELKSRGITGLLYFYQVDDRTFKNLSYETYQSTLSDIISEVLKVTNERKITIE